MESKSVQLWNQAFTISNENKIHSCSFNSHDNFKSFLTADNSGRFKLWSPSVSDPIKKIECCDSKATHSLKFSKKDQSPFFLACGQMKGGILLGNIENGVVQNYKKVFTKEQVDESDDDIFEGECVPITCCCLSPDESLVFGGGMELYIWKRESGEPLITKISQTLSLKINIEKEEEASIPLQLEFLRDNINLLAFGTFSGRFAVIDIKEGKILGSIKEQKEDNSLVSLLSYDPNILVGMRKDCRVDWFDIRTMKIEKNIEFLKDHNVESNKNFLGDFSKDGKFGAYYDQTMREFLVLDVEGGNIEDRIQFESQINDIRVNDNKKEILIACQNGEATLFQKK